MMNEEQYISRSADRDAQNMIEGGRNTRQCITFSKESRCDPDEFNDVDWVKVDIRDPLMIWGDYDSD